MARYGQRHGVKPGETFHPGLTEEEIPGWLPGNRKHVRRDDGELECWYTTRVQGHTVDDGCRCGRPVTPDNTVTERQLRKRKREALKRTHHKRRRGILRSYQRDRRDRTGRWYANARAYYDARPLGSIRALHKILLRQGRPLPKALIDSLQAREDRSSTNPWHDDFYLERDL